MVALLRDIMLSYRLLWEIFAEFIGKLPPSLLKAQNSLKQCPIDTWFLLMLVHLTRLFLDTNLTFVVKSGLFSKTGSYKVLIVFY